MKRPATPGGRKVTSAFTRYHRCVRSAEKCRRKLQRHFAPWHPRSKKTILLYCGTCRLAGVTPDSYQRLDGDALVLVMFQYDEKHCHYRCTRKILIVITIGSSVGTREIVTMSIMHLGRRCVCVWGGLSLPLTGGRSEANHQVLRLQGQDERNRWHSVKETNGGPQW